MWFPRQYPLLWTTQQQYKIKGKCCGSIDVGFKGFGIDSSFELQVTTLYNKFTERLNEPKVYKILNIKDKSSDIDVCCICHEDCNLETFCKHTMCRGCLENGERNFNLKLCPVCRNYLKVF